MQVQTWIIPLLLGASSVLALTAGFTFMTALRLLVDNMSVPFSTAAAVLAASRVADALWAAAVAPVFDRVPLLPVAVGAAIVGTGLRGALAAVVFLGPAGRLWQNALVLPLLMLVTSTDSTVGRALGLQLQKTADSTRTFANAAASETPFATRLFSYNYALSNLGMFVAGSAFDVARTYAGTPATANAIMLALSTACAILTTFLVYSAYQFALYGRHYDPVPSASGGNDDDDDEHSDTAEEEEERARYARSYIGPKGLCQEARELLRDRTLWRFTAFGLCLTGARSVMVHMETTLTEVMMRSFGPTVHFAAIQSINPLLVIAGAPLFQHWLAQYRGYWVIAGGAALSALSVLPVATIAPVPSSSVSIYGPYALFVILFSIGECVWSARFEAYSMSVAPPGKRASYLALASLPLIGVRFVAAWHSGWMVNRYCPAAGLEHCNARALWAWVMGFGLLSPLLLFFGRRWLDPNRRQAEQTFVMRSQE